jgi:hypothetical protein
MLVGQKVAGRVEMAKMAAGEMAVDKVGAMAI